MMRPAAWRVLRVKRFRWEAWALLPDSLDDWTPDSDTGPWFFVSKHWTRSGAESMLREFLDRVCR